LDDLIGIPFINEGRSLDGCDCWGLVRLAFSTYGIIVPDYKISCYASMKIAKQIQKEKEKTWKELPSKGSDIEQIPAPTLVVMMLGDSNKIICNHHGIYIGKGKILHTSKDSVNGSYIVRLDEPSIKDRIDGFYKYSPK